MLAVSVCVCSYSRTPHGQGQRPETVSPCFSVGLMMLVGVELVGAPQVPPPDLNHSSSTFRLHETYLIAFCCSPAAGRRYSTVKLSHPSPSSA